MDGLPISACRHACRLDPVATRVPELLEALVPLLDSFDLNAITSCLFSLAVIRCGEGQAGWLDAAAALGLLPHTAAFRLAKPRSAFRNIATCAARHSGGMQKLGLGNPALVQYLNRLCGCMQPQHRPNWRKRTV